MHLGKRVDIPVPWITLGNATCLEVIGDSKVTCGWVNGQYQCLNDTVSRQVEAVKSCLRLLWEQGVVAPRMMGVDFWRHVERVE